MSSNMIQQRKRSNRILARPENYDTLGEDEKKNYDNQANFLNLSRPVHYSNVQLCVHQRSLAEGGRYVVAHV
jgi:ribosomal protein L24